MKQIETFKKSMPDVHSRCLLVYHPVVFEMLSYRLRYGETSRSNRLGFIELIKKDLK